MILLKRTSTQIDPRIKYFIDECVSFKSTGLTKKNAIYSKEILPPGAPDDEILKVVQKHNLLLITADLRFAVKTAVKNKQAFYQTQEGERYRLRGKIVTTNLFSKKAQLNYLLTHDSIVLP